MILNPKDWLGYSRLLRWWTNYWPEYTREFFPHKTWVMVTSSFTPHFTFKSLSLNRSHFKAETNNNTLSQAGFSVCMLNILSQHLSTAEAVVTVLRQWMGWKLKIWVSQIVGTPKSLCWPWVNALFYCIRGFGREYNLNGLFSSFSQAFYYLREFGSHQQLAWFGMLCQQEPQLIESVTAQRARKSVYQFDSMIQNVAAITLIWNVSCSAFWAHRASPSQRGNNQMPFYKHCWLCQFWTFQINEKLPPSKSIIRPARVQLWFKNQWERGKTNLLITSYWMFLPAAVM